MTPFEQAIAAHLQGCGAAEFYSDLDAHFLHGFVHSDERAFLMMRPVDSSAHPALIVNPKCTFPAEDCDAWFVYLAAGNIADLCKLSPYPLEKVCYLRFCKLKFTGFQSILNKSHRWENVDGGERQTSKPF